MSNDIKNDLINWNAEQLSDDSPVYNSKDLINALNSIMPSLGSVILTTNNHVLSKQEDWDSITMNTLNMFTTMANSGLPANDFPNNSGILLVLGYTSYNIYIAISGEAVYYRLGGDDWNKLLTSETIKDLTGSVATLTSSLSKLSDQQTTLSSLFNTFKDGTNKQLDTLNTQSTSQAKMLEDINNQLLALTGTVDNTGLINAPAFQSLQSQVNNSAVGTNLLTNTGDLSANWNGITSISTTTEYNGHPSMVFTASTQQLAVQQLSLGELQNSTKYIASFWAKADDAGDKAHTEIWGSIGAFDFVLTTNWVRYTAVVTSASDASTNISHASCYFGVPTGNTGNVYIALPKLEKGSVATDWCPNPAETLNEVIDARNGKNNLKTRLDDEYTQVTEQLAQTAKLNRKFKPKITSSTWYVNGGTLTKDPDEEILNDINNVKKMGVDGISYTCHVYIDENTQKLYIGEGVEDTFNMVYSKCLELNLSINVIKFHCKTDVINAYTGDFKADYKDLILRMCEVAKGKVKYFTVLNEVKDVYFNPSYQSFVIELLTTVKSYGFKAGISQMGELDVVQIVDNEWIVPHIDAVFMNYYPSISFKGSEAKYEDSLEAWNIVRAIDLIKRKYNLPFIISETGVMPFWECLSNPGLTGWGGIINTSGKGHPEVYPLYLYGLFNSTFVNENVEEVWLWFGERAYTPQTNNLINSYTGGVQYV